MRETVKKEEELIKQKHSSLCIDRYLTQPDEIYTDRHLAFHPIFHTGRPDQANGVFIRMTNSGRDKIIIIREIFPSFITLLIAVNF